MKLLALSRATPASPLSRYRRGALIILCTLAAVAVPAQSPAAPGKFDFYLMNLSWAPEYCTTGTGVECTEHLGFVMHGLWPQNFSGTYPATCSNTPPPADLGSYLDLIPDLSLLQHEWAKHGTCSGLGGDAFFTLERRAFHSLVVPPALLHLTRPLSITPAALLADFYKANLKFPHGSLAVSCGNNDLTAIEACFSKSTLTPIACQNVSTCGATTIEVLPPGASAASLHKRRRHKPRGLREVPPIPPSLAVPMS